jgi:hypothetical protein
MKLVLNSSLSVDLCSHCLVTSCLLFLLLSPLVMHSTAARSPISLSLSLYVHIRRSCFRSQLKHVCNINSRNLPVCLSLPLCVVSVYNYDDLCSGFIPSFFCFFFLFSQSVKFCNPIHSYIRRPPRFFFVLIGPFIHSFMMHSIANFTAHPVSVIHLLPERRF